jgi:hypothetical protein
MANNNRIVDKNDPKYVLALQFLNHILTNNNKPQIQDILEFKDITRQEILKQENLNKLNEMETELYKHFDKMKCGYYRKTDNYVINFFRGMLKEMGYKAIHIEKDKTVSINGENYRKKIIYYHIE